MSYRPLGTLPGVFWPRESVRRNERGYNFSKTQQTSTIFFENSLKTFPWRSPTNPFIWGRQSPGSGGQLTMQIKGKGLRWDPRAAKRGGSQGTGGPHIKGLVGDLQGAIFSDFSKKYGACLACSAKNVASLVVTDGFTRPKEARECSERSVAQLGAIFRGPVMANSARAYRRG